MADVVVAGTLLVLWKAHNRLPPATQPEITAVLDTLGLTPKNPARSISNCPWLQARGGDIMLSPAETSKAVKLARAYCLKQSPYGDE